MKRWKNSKMDNVENPQIDVFLEEVIAVCRKHGFSIRHEDCHGGFIIGRFAEDEAECLMAASDETDEPTEP